VVEGARGADYDGRFGLGWLSRIGRPVTVNQVRGIWGENESSKAGKKVVEIGAADKGMWGFLETRRARRRVKCFLTSASLPSADGTARPSVNYEISTSASF
jgi:hypothetical protein